MKSPHPLDSVQMNEVARERAKVQLQRAEYVVELVAYGAAKVRSTVRSLFNSQTASERIGAH